MANKLAKRIRPGDTVTLPALVDRVTFLENGKIRIQYDAGFAVDYAPDDTMDVTDGGVSP